MGFKDSINMIRSGSQAWNEWSKNYYNLSGNRIDLKHYNFNNKEIYYPKSTYGEPYLEDYKINNVDMYQVNMRNGTYNLCEFNNSRMIYTDLCDSIFSNCQFRNTNLRVSKLGGATFINCTFENSDLSFCSAQDIEFNDCSFKNCDLSNMTFVNSKFIDSKLNYCRIYGISTWDVVLDNTIQQDLIITKKDDITPITIDNLEMAQFLYLMLNNSKLRNVIDTMTTKVVLILGRFKYERKVILDTIKNEVRNNGLIPILFDFEGPKNRDLTETVQLLASMSKIIIADITDPSCIPHELYSIIPTLRSSVIQPIQLEGERPYAMFNDLLVYPWVNEKISYCNSNIRSITKMIINKKDDDA